MYHLRIVAPPDRTSHALDLLEASPAVCNVILLTGVAREPEGDVIMADMAREDASVLLADLRDLGLEEHGSIAIEAIDTSISKGAERAVREARGAASDAVVWEQVALTTAQEATLSGSYLTFIVLAGLIASVGLYLDSPILIVGAMVVGPEFGPISGFCVGIVQRQRRLALGSLLALVVGFSSAILLTYLVALAFRAAKLIPDRFSFDTGLAHTISSPDFFAFFVAFCAGVAGMLSLTTAKSGALIGVLISVTTIPSAAAVAVAAAYSDSDALAGSAGQLAVNLAMILIAGTLTLLFQRALYNRRLRRHLEGRSRRAAGLPAAPTRERDSEPEPA